MTGEMVLYDVGGDRAGYLALPENGAGPAVLLLHAWWGLNDFFKSTCDQLAAAGYVVFAPDLYGGKVVDTPDEAEALAGALDRAVTADASGLTGAVDFLLQQPGAHPAGIGVIGFSLGAAYAMYLASALRPEAVRAVVLFYGTGPAEFQGASTGAAATAFLGHFAVEDPWEPRENVEALRDALYRAGRPTDFRFYEGAGHWFCEANRPDAYRREAAELAWQRTLAFLAAQLGERGPDPA